MPLHIAAKGGHIDTVKLLLKFDADVNTPDRVTHKHSYFYFKISVLHCKFKARYALKKPNKLSFCLIEEREVEKFFLCRRV